MRVAVIGMLIVSIAMFVGCSRNQTVVPSPNSKDSLHAEQTANDGANTLSGTSAARLEQIAESVPQVHNATVVVFGKTAIVGIDVDGKLDRSHVGTIKYAVAEALHKDPNGARAAVTADMDINERLREIHTALQHGRPLAGFLDELADIVGRILPQFPRGTGKAPDKIQTGNRMQNRSLDTDPRQTQG